MTFKEYQEKAKTTALYDSPVKQMLCSAIGLNTELDEYLEKKCNDPNNDAAQASEISDILWYLAIFTDYMEVNKLKYIPNSCSIFDLPSEVAKFQEKIKKSIRDYNFEIPEKYHDDIIEFLYTFYSSIQDEIEKKRWTITGIMNLNLNKLSDRQVRGVLSGDGDER